VAAGCRHGRRVVGPRTSGKKGFVERTLPLWFRRRGAGDPYRGGILRRIGRKAEPRRTTCVFASCLAQVPDRQSPANQNS
jgi:hypothetical protein